jgi:hypothetical protein
MSEPTVLCEECLVSVLVDYTMGEFPPDVAKRKLEKLCKAQGHKSKPKYQAGREKLGRYEGQAPV